MIVNVGLKFFIVRKVHKYQRGSLTGKGLLNLNMDELNISQARDIAHFVIKVVTVFTTLV